MKCVPFKWLLNVYFFVFVLIVSKSELFLDEAGFFFHYFHRSLFYSLNNLTKMEVLSNTKAGQNGNNCQLNAQLGNMVNHTTFRTKYAEVNIKCTIPKYHLKL